MSRSYTHIKVLEKKYSNKKRKENATEKSGSNMD